MNIQKIQVCLLAIITITLAYIAIIHAGINRYVVFAEGYGTLDTKTGNVYVIHDSQGGSIYGTTYYLYKNGYATYLQDEINFAKKDLRNYLKSDE